MQLPQVEVSDVEIGQQELSFHVDEVGVPVLVKVSYFPNWAVDGAEGPYRVAPNMMVVVPTDNDVRLHYDRSRSDLFFYFLTLVGIGLLVVFRIQGDVDMSARPAPAGAGGGRRCRRRRPTRDARRRRGPPTRGRARRPDRDPREPPR